ncbi:DUF504 domain-containing protein [Acidilobus sp.]|uniref:DUF504 domain-containing protein n=1 Tax=Acidilobus sp. TaxID=1872109 RepID=UPI003CFEC311
MSKRRSVIRQVINRALMSGRPQDYIIIYVDRDPQAGQRLVELNASRIAAVSEWALTLDDGDTVIPLHRVVEVRGPNGETWRRGLKS